MNKVKVLTLKGDTLPKKLRSIPDAPAHIYTKGSLEINALDSRPIVAIVGSRKVDSYGIYATKMLARELAEQGVIIISGLALGTDAIAHQECLEAGTPTIAVLASHVDDPTPHANSTLASKIANNGLLISENDEEHVIQKHDFLIRNRLISGLADGVIIPQASARSGSLNTARHALDQGKTVFAVPGPITNPLCEGPNTLLKMGAVPVTTANDVLLALNIKSPEKKDYDLLAQNQAELDILMAMQDGVSDADELISITKLSAGQFGVHLTVLELRGLIAPLGGNHWTLR